MPEVGHHYDHQLAVVNALAVLKTAHPHILTSADCPIYANWPCIRHDQALSGQKTANMATTGGSRAGTPGTLVETASERLGSTLNGCTNYREDRTGCNAAFTVGGRRFHPAPLLTPVLVSVFYSDHGEDRATGLVDVSPSLPARPPVGTGQSPRELASLRLPARPRRTATGSRSPHGRLPASRLQLALVQATT